MHGKLNKLHVCNVILKLLNLNMATQFITNDKGERTSVIIPINEYEDMVHQHHLNLELTDEYKIMIDKMLAEEDGNVEYVSAENIKKKFMNK